ncbi:hypothetical protein NEUTE1DRAFT_144335 [Neurospora tetrasperma FGSC 2508]|uniref:Uncharacterized protein n=1 Tax=Neurospora tetrasperma (strain FGSC 2508 / ATCC MYA-4615 / P0657) TaxID=510951 RepID=F8MB28_NEUT8|nr:uncharacterized protein NEUTE1DRAFT_144335 [Neurospora tetrasperma FGSC 2508]EGO61047.1 hypothetical protein NEUTE1DRAFT_144335 [Neurospora tetrasperma FGSC 2508]
MRTNREFRRRKRNEQDDKGTTEVTSREDTLPAENTLPAEKHISESAGDTSEPQSVEIVWPAFNHPATTSRPTKVFSLHNRVYCDCSKYFSTSLSPRNRDVFVEAQTGHVVFNGNDDDDDDDDDEPDDFYLWAVWLYVCSGCKHEFQDDHRCRPSRPESGRTASGSSESAARAGEYLYASHKPYGLPQPPVCKSLSNRIAEEEGEGEGDHTRYGGHEDERRRRNCCGNGGNLSSKVTGDPNAPLEAAAAYMFGYRLCCRLRGRGLHNHRGWLAPDLMLNFAADSFTQDKHYLIQLYGKILGIVRRPGAFSGVVPVPEVGMVNRVDDAARNTKSVRVISVG